MSTLQPRPPYSDDELSKLYPSDLELQQVQILLRHGERTPVKPRFQNAGLSPYWPYCSAANQLRSAVLEADGSWSSLQWKRRIQSLGKDDTPDFNQGPEGEVDSICQLGELTDRGRETTLALGQRMRKLYVDQLGFLPAILDAKTVDGVRIRATPIPRALESAQQAFAGLYPSTSQVPGLPPPLTIVRAAQDESLFPNEGACRRFGELARAFAERTAKIYNDGPELAHINKKIGKWMPEESPVVKVDSKPRLTGVMDSVNATLAHGRDTRLPDEFYDKKLIEGFDRICREEWFVGYQESNEYRTLGIGHLIGDMTQKMIERATSTKTADPAFKISIAGCHDTTIAASLAALGAFEVERDPWPKFTSNVAFELFKKRGSTSSATSSNSTGALWPSASKTWWSSLFGSSPPIVSARSPLSLWPENSKRELDDYYVRLRYNDNPIVLPYCKPAGRHLDNDDSFCTLAAFKEAADSFTPKNWKEECAQNLGRPAFKPVIERPPGVL